MKIQSRIRFLLVSLATPLAIALIGCVTRYKFSAANENQSLSSKPKGCDVKFEMHEPDTTIYQLIGICKAKSKDHYRVTNANIGKKAFEALHDCACEYGGDLVAIYEYDDKLDARTTAQKLNPYGVDKASVELEGKVYKKSK